MWWNSPKCARGTHKCPPRLATQSYANLRGLVRAALFPFPKEGKISIHTFGKKCCLCSSQPFPTYINLRGTLGRNTLIGPGLVNFDFSLFKNNYIKRISDAFNVQFRAGFFNIFNRANFAPPLDNRNVFDSNGKPIANAGLITSAQMPSRQIQLALKLIW